MKSHKLKILEKIKYELDEKIKRTRDLMSANPLSEICKLRIQFAEIAEKYGILSEETTRFARTHSDIEQQLFAQAKAQNEINYTELFEMESELEEVNRQIWRETKNA